MEANRIIMNRSLSLLLICMIFLMLHTTCDGFYRKPYVGGSGGGSVIIQPKKPASKPRPPVKLPGSHATLPPDVKQGGNHNPYSTGWGVTFNIYVWVVVIPITEVIYSWRFRTTTVPSPVVEYWYTTEYARGWGYQIRSYDDQADQLEKKRNGLAYTCFSWDRTCANNQALRDRIIRDRGSSGRMRSIGGGSDGTDSTLIAFIVIAILIGAGIGGLMYYQKRDASVLADDEGEIDDEAKVEPEPPAEDGDGIEPEAAA